MKADIGTSRNNSSFKSEEEIYVKTDRLIGDGLDASLIVRHSSLYVKVTDWL